MKRFLSALLCVALALMLLPALFQTASAEGLTHFNIRLDEPVASFTPDYTPEFPTDEIVYEIVTWQEKSPGFNMKLNQHDEFMSGIAYKVVIRVRLNEGTYLATDANGDLAAALTVNNKAISSLEIHDRDSQNRIKEVTITCEYDPLPGMKISSVLIKGVPTPVAGNMPGYSFSLGSSSYGFYNTEPVIWIDKTSNKTLDSSDTFIEGHVYQLCIWLYANREGGFTFKTDEYDNPQVDATINSWAADKVNKAYEQEGREVIEVLYTFSACEASHTCAPQLVQLQKPTCVMPGFKAYYECSCGKCYEDAAAQKEITDLDGYGIIPADGHKEGAWSYNGTHHYKKCTTCKEVIPGTTAAHSGGTATCIKKAVCTTCDFAYGDVSTDHKWSPTYLYKDSEGHAWICADCRIHSEIEAHKPGPAATETTPQKCTECDYVIEPVKNHTHELKFLPEVKPTCLASGTIAHYACTGCTALFSDAEGKEQLSADTSVFVPPVGHATSDNWSVDDEYHWRTCSNCQEVLTETRMLHEFTDGKCSTCNHTIKEDPAPTETTPVQPDDQEEPSGIDTWVIVLVVGVLCFCAAIVATVLILKKKKH